MKSLLVIFIAIILLQLSCKSKMTNEEIFRIGTTECARQPLFVINLGFDPKRSAFSTSQVNIKGLALVELPKVTSDSTGFKTYQHESWKKEGFMGAITTGIDGTIYTVPVPMINTLNRSLAQMNKVYKVNPRNGEMVEFCKLPNADTSVNVVPYACLGVFYDCHANKLYVSTVAGSSRENENGVIYVIEPQNGKIIDKYEKIDAMGLFISGITGEKRLYFGNARNSEINSIEIEKTGEFIGKHQLEFSLEQLGPRGDDKARRIIQDKNGNLNIFGVEFNYNLTAPTVIPQSAYKFSFDEVQKKWIFQHVQNIQ